MARRLAHHARVVACSAAAAGGSCWLALRSAPTSAEAAVPWDNEWDGRNDRRTQGVRRIILVRHGQYVYGKTDEARVLTALGREQAKRTGERLAAMYATGGGAEIDDVVFSTMMRATETSNIIRQVLGAQIPARSDDLIREGAPIVPIPAHPTWQPSPATFAKDGARIAAGFEQHIHRAPSTQHGVTTTLLVCHGNVIRYFVMRALQLQPSAWLRTSVGHASITILTIQGDGRVSLSRFGDCGHLPVDMVTYS